MPRGRSGKVAKGRTALEERVVRIEGLLKGFEVETLNSVKLDIRKS